MEDLLEVSVPRPPQLLETESFDDTHTSCPFTPQPGSVHFRGFEAKRQYTQTIRLVNTSGSSQRLHILPPQSPFFSIDIGQKRGLVAAGMAQKVTVAFTPLDIQDQYQDFFYVKSSVGNFRVPLFGYQVLEGSVARTVDFRTVPIFASQTRVIRIPSSASVPFEFTVEAAGDGSNDSQCFCVAPRSGVIKPGKGAAIVVTFTPQKPVSYESSFVVSISAYNREPERLVCVGSGRLLQSKRSSSLHRVFESKSLLSEAKGLSSTQTLGDAQTTPARTTNTRGTTTTTTTRGTTTTTTAATSGSGEDGDHPPLPATVRLRKARPARVWRKKPHAHTHLSQAATTLSSHSAVAAVLSAQEGKMKLSELREAIRQRKTSRGQAATAAQAHTSAQRKGEDGWRFGLDYSEHSQHSTAFPGDSDQMRELIFARNVRALKEHERTVEINPTKARLGQRVITRDKHEQIREQAGMEVAVDQQTQRLAGLLTADEHTVKATRHSYDDDNKGSSTHAVFTTQHAQMVSKFTPPSHTEQRSEWDQRKRQLRRFVSNVSKLIVRRRVDRRLALIVPVLLKNSTQTETNVTTVDTLTQQQTKLQVTPPPRSVARMCHLTFGTHLITPTPIPRPQKLTMPSLPFFQSSGTLPSLPSTAAVGIPVSSAIGLSGLAGVSCIGGEAGMSPGVRVADALSFASHRSALPGSHPSYWTPLDNCDDHGKLVSSCVPVLGSDGGQTALNSRDNTLTGPYDTERSTDVPGTLSVLQLADSWMRNQSLPHRFSRPAELRNAVPSGPVRYGGALRVDAHMHASRALDVKQGASQSAGSTVSAVPSGFVATAVFCNSAVALQATQVPIHSDGLLNDSAVSGGGGGGGGSDEVKFVRDRMLPSLKHHWELTGDSDKTAVFPSEAPVVYVPSHIPTHTHPTVPTVPTDRRRGADNNSEQTGVVLVDLSGANKDTTPAPAPQKTPTSTRSRRDHNSGPNDDTAVPTAPLSLYNGAQETHTVGLHRCSAQSQTLNDPFPLGISSAALKVRRSVVQDGGNDGTFEQRFGMGPSPVVQRAPSNLRANEQSLVEHLLSMDAGSDLPSPGVNGVHYAVYGEVVGAVAPELEHAEDEAFAFVERIPGWNTRKCETAPRR